MKNIAITSLFLICINTISFGQKTYILTGEGDQHPTLESMVDFKPNQKYSLINESLILDSFFNKNDTEIVYLLISQEQKVTYKLIVKEKNKRHFIKKYCKEYIVKRKTPVL